MAIVDGYATLPEVKADLRLTTTADDSRLERCIEAASRQIDNITHRKWNAPAVEARTFAARRQFVWVDECETITLVEESDDQSTWATVAATAYMTNPSGPVRRLERITGEWDRYVRVAATYDGAAIPPEVNQACRLQSVRLFKRPDTPEGVLVGDFGAAQLTRIDPDVLNLIRPLKRRVVG